MRQMRAGAAAAVFALVLCLWSAWGWPARGAETRITLDRSFALVDADGRQIEIAAFTGKLLLIYFGYTHCSDQCPTALSAMTEALDQIGPAAERVQPLFITVDPERDHGAMLRDYTASFDKRIIGLTGAQNEIAAIAKTLAVKYEKVLVGDGNYVIDHSATFSVIDPSGRWAVTFASAEPYMIAAKLLEVLGGSGLGLGAVNNLGAFR